MEKIFTPEIIVALITGVLSLFTLFIKTNKESKLSRITDERTKWRDEIRNIAKKLSATNQLTENAMSKKKILPPREYYAQSAEGGSCHQDR